MIRIIPTKISSQVGNIQLFDLWGSIFTSFAHMLALALFNLWNCRKLTLEEDVLNQSKNCKIENLSAWKTWASLCVTPALLLFELLRHQRKYIVMPETGCIVPLCTSTPSDKKLFPQIHCKTGNSLQVSSSRDLCETHHCVNIKEHESTPDNDSWNLQWDCLFSDENMLMNFVVEPSHRPENLHLLPY